MQSSTDRSGATIDTTMVRQPYILSHLDVFLACVISQMQLVQLKNSSLDVACHKNIHAGLFTGSMTLVVPDGGRTVRSLATIDVLQVVMTLPSAERGQPFVLRCLDWKVNKERGKCK